MRAVEYAITDAVNRFFDFGAYKTDRQAFLTDAAKGVRPWLADEPSPAEIDAVITALLALAPIPQPSEDVEIFARTAIRVSRSVLVGEPPDEETP